MVISHPKSLCTLYHNFISKDDIFLLFIYCNKQSFYYIVEKPFVQKKRSVLLRPYITEWEN